jgi:selenocysteine lyase/cysteine desulfurase
VRRFIGAPKSEQVIFVRGTTEAINCTDITITELNFSKGAASVPNRV